MADIRYLDENSSRQLITLVKTSTKNKLEVRWVEQLPTTDIQNNIIYLIESGTSSTTKNCEAYLYLNDTIGWVKVSGSDTQMDIMPAANTENKGKIVQYVGDTNTDYIHGYFYECIETSTDIFEWVNVNIQDGGDSSQVTIMPTPSSATVDKVVQYIGDTTTEYTHGYFYKCLEGNTNPVTYIWEQINVQPKSKPTLVGETLIF